MKLKTLLTFFLDKQIALIVFFILGIEIVFQLGIYTPYLKKNSYAANVNLVTNQAIESKKDLEPDVLILGTSIAFEGISLRLLNQALSSDGIKVQTIAVRASELIVQHAILKKYIDSFPKVKVLVHIIEPGMAWVDKDELTEPTLSMLSEVDSIATFRYISDFEYKPIGSDYLFLAFKTIAYRKDIADFIVNPQDRLKAISRRKSQVDSYPYVYENPQLESIEGYSLQSLEDCVTRLPNQTLIPPNSNPDHKRMLYETCLVSLGIPKEPHKTERTERYFRRLKKNYSILQDRNIKIINVFAPYSNLLRSYSPNERMLVWKEGLQEALGERQTLVSIDMQDSLGVQDNGEFCFDMIHLNKKGMELFTQKLAEELKKVILLSKIK